MKTTIISIYYIKVFIREKEKALPIGKLATCRDDLETLLKNIDNIKICPGYGGIWSLSCEITLEGKNIKCKFCCQLQ